MNIKIVDDNASLRHLEVAKEVLAEGEKRNRKTILFVFLLSLPVLLFTLIGEDFGMGRGIIFMNAIGCIFLVVAGYRKREKIVAGIRNAVLRHYGAVNSLTIIIGEEEIRYDSEQIKIVMRWGMITSYALFSNYIILIQDADITRGIVIDKRLMKEEDVNELLLFLGRTKPKTIDFKSPL